MSDQLKISAKKLGWLAMPDFCERCFWICQHLTGPTPFSIFPSIFSKIDVYTKHVVHTYFDRHGKPPPWLKDLGELIGYIDPPSHNEFNMVVKRHNVLLRGTPDAVFTRADGSLIIADYKTAFPKGEDDSLFPIYQTQLAVYAVLAAHTKLGSVSNVALVYTTPRTGADAANDDCISDEGFSLKFDTHIFDVPLALDSLDGLLLRARSIYDQSACPDPRDGCRECKQLDKMIAIATELPQPWVHV